MGPAHDAPAEEPGRGVASASGGADVREQRAALPLTDHTVVARVVGDEDTLRLFRDMHDAGWSRTAAVVVRTADPTVVPSAPEDREGVVDLPDRRWGVAAALGAAVGFVLVGMVGTAVGDSAAVGLITGGFGAVIGAVIGAMSGGLGRHAGERAWAQPHVPGRSMGMVFTFADGEAEARQVAHLMERDRPHDVRVVNSSGAWHLPS